MTRLALTMRVVEEAAYAETRDALSHDWQRWLSEHEYGFALVPNCVDEPGAFLGSLSVDGLILTGGNDLVASSAGSGSISAQRTLTENALLRAAIDWSLPVFATCRGLHLVNAFFGGSLSADLGRTSNGSHPHVNCTHPIEISPAFQPWARGPALDVNSFHKQGFSEAQRGAGLTVIATSPADGVVEGVVHDSYPIVAVQWHPERPNPAAAFDNTLIEQLLARGAFWCRA